MFGRLRHAVIGAAGLFGLAAVVLADSAYLPNVGPVPLRFRIVPLLPTNIVSLPAPYPLTAADTEADDADAADTADVVAIPPLSGADGSKAVVMESSSEPPPGPPPAFEPVISPQMLIPFFRPSTTATNLGTVAPVGFLPPSPSAPPAAKPAP
jgi:hypothetical protein